MPPAASTVCASSRRRLPTQSTWTPARRARSPHAAPRRPCRSRGRSWRHDAQRVSPVSRHRPDAAADRDAEREHERRDDEPAEHGNELGLRSAASGAWSALRRTGSLDARRPRSRRLGERELLGVEPLGRQPLRRKLSRAGSRSSRAARRRARRSTRARRAHGEPRAREESFAVARHDRDREPVATRLDRAQLLEEVRLVLVLDAVVEVDGRAVARCRGCAPCRGTASRRSRRPSRPAWRRTRCGARRTRTGPRRRPPRRLELPQRARVVAERLDGDPQHRLVRRGRDRERVELVHGARPAGPRAPAARRRARTGGAGRERERAEADEQELARLVARAACRTRLHDDLRDGARRAG